MSSSGSLSGRVGALGATAATLLAKAGRARPPVPAVPAGPAGADLEELRLASPPGAPPGRAPSMAQTAALVERLTMETDLRNALGAGDLVLRYQPIVDLATGRIIAFETLKALARSSSRKATTKKSKASKVQPRNPARTACREWACMSRGV